MSSTRLYTHSTASPPNPNLWRVWSQPTTSPSMAAAPTDITPGVLPPGHSILEEGSAKIIYSTENKVFYNNVQVFNRDLSVLTMKMFLEQRKAEAMDASRDARPRSRGGRVHRHGTTGMRLSRLRGHVGPLSDSQSSEAGASGEAAASAPEELPPPPLKHNHPCSQVPRVCWHRLPAIASATRTVRLFSKHFCHWPSVYSLD